MTGTKPPPNLAISTRTKRCSTRTWRPLPPGGVFTARHTGLMPTPVGEIPPTGSSGSFPFACFFQVRDGRCVSHRVYRDNMAMLAQMGAPG